MFCFDEGMSFIFSASTSHDHCVLTRIWEETAARLLMANEDFDDSGSPPFLNSKERIRAAGHDSC